MARDLSHLGSALVYVRGVSSLHFFLISSICVCNFAESYQAAEAMQAVDTGDWKALGTYKNDR